jgi:hypothetical protein
MSWDGFGTGLGRVESAKSSMFIGLGTGGTGKKGEYNNNNKYQTPIMNPDAVYRGREMPNPKWPSLSSGMRSDGLSRIVQTKLPGGRAPVGLCP